MSPEWGLTPSRDIITIDVPEQQFTGPEAMRLALAILDLARPRVEFSERERNYA